MTPADGRPAQPAPCGLLVIDKPLGPTSMDVCRRIRWRLVQGGAPKRVKVGHGGTLDPLATGVLVVMVGKATKLCESVMAGTKVYLTQIDLSCFSTTDDQEGEKTVVQAQTPPMREAVNAACARFVGPAVPQTPPVFSAMKVDGKRAYDMARRGEDVKLVARPVRIDRVEVKAYTWPLLTVEVECGKGTYIRSLARDIGGVLGTGGCLTSLRRTRVGQWTVEQALALESLPEKMGQEHLMPLNRG
ncbi:MAG TPA: tRNA pseudouridine(55) synthase TruB [Phycisphaerales bacterium]|nr:tRNA pseudouridine(55) synthase TruB [Phycisphaerales bacterium]